MITEKPPTLLASRKRMIISSWSSGTVSSQRLTSQAHALGKLYALCGQAQTSIRWLEKPRDLFSHFMRREPRRYMGKEGTRYEVGTEKDLLRIWEKVDVQPIRLRVFIVQPGLSVAGVSREQLELLAVTESYLVDTFAVPLEIIGSD